MGWNARIDGTLSFVSG